MDLRRPADYVAPQMSAIGSITERLRERALLARAIRIARYFDIRKDVERECSMHNIELLRSKDRRDAPLYRK